jgi:DNA-binding NtrC family response regulator
MMLNISKSSYRKTPMTKQEDIIHVAHLDDDELWLDSFRKQAQKIESRLHITSYMDLDQLLQALPTKPYLVLLDVNLDGHGGRQGVSAIAQIRATVPQVPIIMFSSDLGALKQAIKGGADDFISKRSPIEEVALRIVKNAGSRPLNTLKNQSSAIGKMMQDIGARVPRIIQSAVQCVLVRGESGTGKEVVADLVHQALPANVPFVRVNCAAIPNNLIESELFGYVKGAFTGAVGNKTGLLQAASGGWIFLDELATLSLSAQAALLRAIENHEIIPVGAHAPVTVDIRVIAATNEPLEEMVQKGTFRRDLLQRLQETEIQLLPLRARPEEIDAMLTYFCAKEKGGPYALADEARDILRRCTWTEGNVRALRNCIRAMTEKHTGQLLTPASIPSRIWDQIPDDIVENTSPTSLPKFAEIALMQDGSFATFDALCDQLLANLVTKMGQSGLSLGTIAKNLGLPKSTLSSRLKRLTEKNVLKAENLKQMFHQGNLA